MDELFDKTVAGNEIASLAIAPGELDLLAKIGIVTPVGEGRFALSADFSAADRPATFRAAVSQDENSFVLSGDTAGLRAIDAVLGEFRYSRVSDTGGMLSQTIGYNRGGYGAEVGEDRGGKELRFQTPDFAVSRYKGDGMTNTRLEGEQGYIGLTRDASGRKETSAGLNFGDRKGQDWQTTIGAAVDNQGGHRFDIRAQKRF